MTLKNSPDRWGGISQSLHWLILLLIFATAIIGLTMGELPRTPKYFWVYTAHKSLGICVLALMLLRLVWRLYAGAPAPVPGTPRWQELIASLTHWAIYAIAIAVPLSGWIYDSASGLRPFRWFGWIEMPKLVRPQEWLAEQTRNGHELLFWVLALLVMMHAGAALYHHLFLRDDTLRRMLPRFGKQTS